jgi:hypothetical protein
MTETLDLAPLKDDMIAFIEGHGIRRFPAELPDHLSRIWWGGPDGPDSWKDFVEMAKSMGAPVLLMDDDQLGPDDVEMLVDGLQEFSNSGDDADRDDIDAARRLRKYTGMVGHIELAIAYQGFLFVHETTTQWYREYRYMAETLESMQEMLEEDSEEE